MMWRLINWLARVKWREKLTDLLIIAVFVQVVRWLWNKYPG